MEVLNIAGQDARGVSLQREAGRLDWRSLFGLSCAAEPQLPECGGIFYLDTDEGRFEGEKWETAQIRPEAEGFQITQRAGSFLLDILLSAEPESGVIRWQTTLKNCGGAPRVIYACLPRIPLQGSDFEFYGQYSGWCAENQGGWTSVPAGNFVLTNSAGRSTESCTPFACVRHKTSDLAAAVHVIPSGDWIIRFRRIAGHRTSYTVLEAGLSDASLRLKLQAGEVIELPELLLSGFSGAVENSCEGVQRYLLRRFAHDKLPELVYNSWFLDFDLLEVDELQRQVQAAKDVGCKIFVVDAGWFGKGADWENQVGNWDECTERAFGGRMRDFADYVRSQGMAFGLWMEPERACAGTKVYQEHPEWFLHADTIIFDLTQPDVVNYLAAQVTRLVETYGLRWMKLDYNTNMLRDLTGENFYRYYLGERQFMAEIRRRNPMCSFEGCASGGMRTDVRSVMTYYHGHFVSDTVNPLEVLRMRQNTVVRLLPAYMGSWMVLQETPFAIGTYFNHNRDGRTKVLAAGDGWWEKTVDVSVEFALAVNLLGEWGISGDLDSLSAENRGKIRSAAARYEAYRGFMARTICHPLTALRPVDDYRGWAALQYENIDGQGSLLFVFRLVDDAQTLYVYPKNLVSGQRYHVTLAGESMGVKTAEELNAYGICVTCPDRFEARIMELIPVKADQNQ